MQAVGATVWVDDEARLDAVTALSGSGPAYVFRFIESMIAGGEALGLTPEQARALTLQTVRGAAELAVRSDEPPSVLRERVTSKGGTTAAALDARGLPAIVADAMAAANTRSEELGREFGR
jgi:pyrroline-5-carboxylate reductase